MAVFASTRQNQPHVQQNIPRAGSKPKKSTMMNKGKAREIQGAQVLPTTNADTSPWSEETDTTDWQWSYLNDFSTSKVTPLFSKDGSYFFSFSGSSVKILSVSTGQVVSELNAPAGKDNGQTPPRFTSAVINPDNAFQLITSTLEGRIIIWDFLNAVILREIDVCKPIHYICAHRNVKDSIFVAASLNKKKTQENDAIVLQVSLNHGSSGKSSAEVRSIGKTRSPSGLAISPSGEWLVSIGGHTVYVARISALDTGFIKYVSADRLSCLAMHPSDEYFATGDEKGIIRLWYCLNDAAVKSRGVEQKAQTTSLHWHAHSVAALSFTPNGAYLLSGGEEAVLVIWQLHTGRKEFVPRVGSPIVTISAFQGPLSEEYLLGLQDGTFSFVSPSSLRIVRSFSQLKIGLDVAQGQTPTTYAPLAFHQPSSSLILPSSHQSSLQIYSPFSQSLVGELEVSPSNRVSRRDDKPLEAAKVRLVALASSGLWMSTVDVREEEPGYQPEVFLKIWSWDSKTSSWQLHSRIDQPHGFKYPIQLKFSPHSPTAPLFLSSCGEDGAVKIWKLRTKTKEDLWLPHATLTFPPSHVKDLAWSPDGTIIAVVSVNQALLYDTSFTVIDTLSTFEQKNTISVHFIGNRYLLVVGRRCLTTWDLISRSVPWTFIPRSDVDFAIAHHNKASFAVFLQPNVTNESTETHVYAFDVESSRPRGEHSLPLQLRNVVSAASPQEPRYNLLGLTQDSRIVVIDGDSSKLHTAHKPSLSFGSAKTTVFRDMFRGASMDSLEVVSPTPITSTARNTDSTIVEAFSQPTHLMAPIALVFDELMSSLLQPGQSAVDATLSDDEEDSDDEAMEDIVMTSTTRSLPPIDTASLQPLVSFFRQSFAKCMSLFAYVAPR
ncbi:TFIID and SAGA subunit, variant 2 [Coprinopsis cinerea AmutBmut pab1-1]|nr:TFIID and SAGA subunit, variant 2 [Coprinopsis cinerea AmutBmut pab1-1]